MSSYQIVEFDGVALPLYNPDQDIGTGAADSTLVASVGGVFDTWPSVTRLPRLPKHLVRGIYAGDGTQYLTDHSGNILADHSGNRLLARTTQQYLRQQVDAIRGKLGAAGQLWRQRWDDTSIRQWKTARLLQVAEKGDPKQRTAWAELTCTFETAMAAWRDATADVVSGTLVSGGAVGLLLDSAGNAQIDDTVLTVTASGGTITSLQLSVLHLGVDLRWTGTLASGSSLVIDCGAQTVTAGGSDAYSGFSLGAGHTARGWLPLPPGVWALQVTSDGPGTVQYSHYDQWL